MPLKIDCSRCKQTLAVPTQKAGSFVQCPRCQGRVWVPEDAANASSAVLSAPVVAPPPASGVASAAAPTVPPISGPIQPGQRVPPAPPPPAGASSAPTLPPPTIPPQAPPVAAPAPSAAANKKTARFIAAESAASTIRPTADGKLPELKLHDGQPDDDAQKAKRTALNPLVLLAVLSLSVTFSVLLVFVDFSDNRGANYERKAAARFAIEQHYFPDVRESALDKTKKLEPYQVYLSEAQQAYARKDRRSERAMYLKVLNLLRAERGTYQKGLTGSVQRDKELEEYVTTLLSED